MFAPNFVIEELSSLIPGSRPAVPITYSGADRHIEFIRKLKKSSIVAAVSASESMLKTARSLFALAIGRKHTFQAILFSRMGPTDLRGIDLAFCDSLAFNTVSCRHKIHYQLVDPKCLEHLAMTLRGCVPQLTGNPVRRFKYFAGPMRHRSFCFHELWVTVEDSKPPVLGS